MEVAERNRQAALAQLASSNAKIAAANQAVESAQSNVKQLKALQGFQKVVAPTDGVITERFVDAGSLVAAGGANGTTEIVSMARTDVLRNLRQRPSKRLPFYPQRRQSHTVFARVSRKNVYRNGHQFGRKFELQLPHIAN